MAPEQDQNFTPSMPRCKASASYSYTVRVHHFVQQLFACSGGVMPDIYDHPLLQIGERINADPHRGSRRVASFTARVQSYQYEFDKGNDDVNRLSRQMMHLCAHKLLCNAYRRSFFNAQKFNQITIK
jgi:hypothetical protein